MTKSLYSGTPFSLAGKIAIVTGAGGHLGRPMAQALAQAAAHVILVGRRAEALEPLRDFILAEGYSAELAVCDVTGSGATDAIASVLQKRSKLDILVHNSYAGKSGGMESSDSEYIDAYTSVVVAGARLTRDLRCFLKAAGQASIINIASMYGIVSPDPEIYRPGEENPPFYGAAKAGLIQWTRYAAVNLASHGIRVNAISPGPFPQPSVVATNPDFAAKLVAKTPMKRLGLADEMKGPVLFLASDASSYVTGANIVVDGGWTAW